MKKKSLNDQLVIIKSLSSMYQRCQDALRLKNTEQFNELLRQYQEMLIGEITRQLGTPEIPHLFDSEKEEIHPFAFADFETSVREHIMGIATLITLSHLDLTLAINPIVYYPSQTFIIFIECLEKSGLKQCVMSQEELMQRAKENAVRESTEEARLNARASRQSWFLIASQAADMVPAFFITDATLVIPFEKSLESFSSLSFPEKSLQKSFSPPLDTVGVKKLAGIGSAIPMEITTPVLIGSVSSNNLSVLLNEVRQSTHILLTKVFPNGKLIASETSEEFKKHKRILESTIQRFSHLISSIITEEDFAWYVTATMEIHKCKEILLSKREIILERYRTTLIEESGEKPYDIKIDLDYIDKKFKELDDLNFKKRVVVDVNGFFSEKKIMSALEIFEKMHLPRECKEETMLWVLLMSSEVVIFKRTVHFLLREILTLHLIQSLESTLERLHTLLNLLKIRNNQLENEIDRGLSVLEQQVKETHDRVEEFFDFTEKAKQWTLQLFSRPQRCEFEPFSINELADVELGCSSAVDCEKFIYTQNPMSTDVVEISPCTLQPKHVICAETKLMSDISDDAILSDAFLSERYQSCEEKFIDLFLECQTEQEYLREFLFLCFDENTGLESCKRRSGEQKSSFDATRSESDLSVQEWQTWQQKMFSYLQNPQDTHSKRSEVSNADCTNLSEGDSYAYEK